MAPRRTPPPEVEHLPWPAFVQQFTWAQGEHVSCIGPTGGGKTTLALELIQARAERSPHWFSAVIATKPADPLLSKVARRKDWALVRKWPPPYGTQRVIVWPRWRGRQDNAAQAAAVRHALDKMMEAGHWCCLMDEVAYAVRKLGLDGDLRDWWQQGRSMGLTLVGLTQRPAYVPLDMYSQPTHLFFWRSTDRDDLRRISGVGGLDPEPIRAAVSTLPTHHVLYVDTRTGRMLRTVAERTIT